jgi:hypothetical protein
VGGDCYISDIWEEEITYRRSGRKKTVTYQRSGRKRSHTGDLGGKDCNISEI